MQILLFSRGLSGLLPYPDSGSDLKLTLTLPLTCVYADPFLDPDVYQMWVPSYSEFSSDSEESNYNFDSDDSMADVYF
jgi:hypothetical protein